MICKTLVLQEFELIFLLSSIAIFSTQLNGYHYCYQALNFFKITISCLHIVKWSQVLLFNTNYSIQHYPFVCTQLNSSKYH